MQGMHRVRTCGSRGAVRVCVGVRGSVELALAEVHLGVLRHELLEHVLLLLLLTASNKQQVKNSSSQLLP